MLSVIRTSSIHTAIGTRDYHRRTIEEGLRSSDQPLISIVPPYGTQPYGFIEGRLPENFGNISYSAIHAVTSTRAM